MVRLRPKLIHQLVCQAAFRRHHGSVLRPAGAHEHGARKLTAKLRGIGARQKGTHAVAHEKIGRIRIFLAHQKRELAHVAHKILRAARPKIAECAAFGNRPAMPQVIVDRHRKAFARQPVCKREVKLAVLRHAVGNLQHTAHLSVCRRNLPRKDALLTGTGVKGKFLLQQIHHSSSPLRIRRANKRHPFCLSAVMAPFSPCQGEKRCRPLHRNPNRASKTVPPENRKTWGTFLRGLLRHFSFIIQKESAVVLTKL